MKKLVRLFFGLCFSVMTLSGCGDSVDYDPSDKLSGSQSKIYVTFKVSITKEPGSPTRAVEEGVWGNHPLETEGGYPFDCQILRRNFSALLYQKEDNKLVGTITNLEGWNNFDDPAEYTLTFRGTLDTEITDEEFKASDEKAYKIMVIVNIPEKFDPTSEGASVEDLTFSHKGMEWDFPAVPMWGVQSVTLNDLKYGFEGEELPENELADVPLLRAMAMVRVNIDLDEDQSDYQLYINSLTLNRHNGSGYTLPSNWEKHDDTKLLARAETLRELEAEVQEGVYSVDAKTEKCQSMRFYIPEIDNSKEDSEVIMTINYTVNGETREGEIRFRDYTEDGKLIESGVPYDIIRNHIYEFNIIRVKENDLLLHAAVRDWRIIRYEYYY